MVDETSGAEEYAESGYDVNSYLRDIEDKHNLLKDRVLLIGENMVSSREELEKEIADIRLKMLDVEGELKKLKLAMQRTIDDSSNLVRKNEFEILKRQFEMFQPLELARISDVKSIVNKEINKISQPNNK